MTARFQQNVIVPAWILTFGCVSLIVAPLGLVTSLSLFVLGVILIPALVLIPVAVLAAMPARTTQHTRRTLARVLVAWK